MTLNLDQERVERAAEAIATAELDWKAANGGDSASCVECPDEVKARAAIAAYLGNDVVFPLANATIQKAREFPSNEVIGVSIIALVEPENFDRLPAILARSARSVYEAPDLPFTPATPTVNGKGE